MKASRRAFLKLAALASALVRFPGFLSCFVATVHAREADASLIAYLDTLLPAGPGPAASGVGVESAIMTAARNDPAYARFLAEGVHWLNAQARADGGDDFSGLSESQRERIVARGADAHADSFEHRFFVQIRHDAFTAFYTDARSWAGLNYEGPPQPRGFSDYAGPPGANSA